MIAASTISVGVFFQMMMMMMMMLLMFACGLMVGKHAAPQATTTKHAAPQATIAPQATKTTHAAPQATKTTHAAPQAPRLLSLRLYELQVLCSRYNLGITGDKKELQSKLDQCIREGKIMITGPDTMNELMASLTKPTELALFDAYEADLILSMKRDGRI